MKKVILVFLVAILTGFFTPGFAAKKGKRKGVFIPLESSSPTNTILEIRAVDLFALDTRGNGTPFVRARVTNIDGLLSAGRLDDSAFGIEVYKMDGEEEIWQGRSFHSYGRRKKGKRKKGKKKKAKLSSKFTFPLPGFDNEEVEYNLYLVNGNQRVAGPFKAKFTTLDPMVPHNPDDIPGEVEGFTPEQLTSLMNYFGQHIDFQLAPRKRKGRRFVAGTEANPNNTITIRLGRRGKVGKSKKRPIINVEGSSGGTAEQKGNIIHSGLRADRSNFDKDPRGTIYLAKDEGKFFVRETIEGEWMEVKINGSGEPGPPGPGAKIIPPEYIGLEADANTQKSIVKLNDILGDGSNLVAKTVTLESSVVAGNIIPRITIDNGNATKVSIHGEVIDLSANPPVSQETAFRVPDQDFGFWIEDNLLNLVNFPVGKDSFTRKEITANFRG